MEGAPGVWKTFRYVGAGRGRDWGMGGGGPGVLGMLGPVRSMITGGDGRAGSGTLGENEMSRGEVWGEGC